MEIQQIKRLISELGGAMNSIIAKIKETPDLSLSREQALFSIEAHIKVLETMKQLTHEQRQTFNETVTHEMSVWGAQDTYSDKSIAVYAFVGLQGLNNITK